MEGAKAELELEFDSEEEARAIFGALEPEAASVPSDRTRARLGLEGRKILISIEGASGPSFRAALGAYLRWAKVAKTVLS